MLLRLCIVTRRSPESRNICRFLRSGHSGFWFSLTILWSPKRGSCRSTKENSFLDWRAPAHRFRSFSISTGRPRPDIAADCRIASSTAATMSARCIMVNGLVPRAGRRSPAHRIVIQPAHAWSRCPVASPLQCVRRACRRRSGRRRPLAPWR